MKSVRFVLLAVPLVVMPAWGAGGGGGLTDISFLSVNQPPNCNTADNKIVTSQELFGQAGGYGCLRTLIFPQFAIGDGWTTQATGILPTQAAVNGLVTGTVPGFAVVITAGSNATAAPDNGPTVLLNSVSNGCLGFWDSVTGTATTQGFAVIDSGHAAHGDFTSMATQGKCTGGTDTQVAGLAQGPMQVQVIAPTAAAVNQATTQVTYFYDGGTFQWQATVNPVDINGAKPRWTAPLYQGGPLNYVTAFSVVNASGTPQTVNVALRDDTGNPITNPKATPMLAPGCGCNEYGQSAVGGFYASTVADFFGDIGTQSGSIEFTGSSGNIVVIVLRWIKESMGSVPAR
jgi:hypothetical protein